ncbi:hypothetical protein EUTSA_v10023958mg [Eutrema salsugineum]|uniref:Ubiquitin-like protease family profile domain-containing protein n=1 Tax=Eutrema salsugineum TaxID=72664 RepID=V4JW62_EUTSA|nr:hypothetical protein EUTSA_v10023958mg [Eutrema salsugineum]
MDVDPTTPSQQDDNSCTPAGARESQIEEGHVHRRVSKRLRTVSTKYNSLFLCDKRVRSIIGQKPVVDEAEKQLDDRFEKSYENFQKGRNFANIERYKRPSRETETSYGFCMIGRHLLWDDSRKPRADVLDAKFFVSLTSVGEVDHLQLFTEADVLYILFNLDIKHWIFLVVEVITCKIQVIDCNVSLRSEFCPIAEMLPNLFREVGANEQMSQVATSQYEIQRISEVPQIKSTGDAGFVSYFLMLSHAIFGLPGCLEFDLTHIDLEVKKVSTVMIEQYL